MQTKLKDNGRMGLWGFLAVIVISQLYVVRELLAAFALFALAFATIAFVLASLYMLPHCWELAGSGMEAFQVFAGSDSGTFKGFGGSVIAACNSWAGI